MFVCFVPNFVSLEHRPGSQGGKKDHISLLNPIQADFGFWHQESINKQSPNEAPWITMSQKDSVGQFWNSQTLSGYERKKQIEEGVDRHQQR